MCLLSSPPSLVCFCLLVDLHVTCDPACTLSVSSPSLQQKEVIASLCHPQFESVLQNYFLRFQPHFVQQGGTRGRSSLFGLLPLLSSAMGRPEDPAYSRSLWSWFGSWLRALSMMILLFQNSCRFSHFFTPDPHARFTAAVHSSAHRSSVRAQMSHSVCSWKC